LRTGAVTIANRSLINQRAVCPAIDTITVNGQQQAFKFSADSGTRTYQHCRKPSAPSACLSTSSVMAFIESIADQSAA